MRTFNSQRFQGIAGCLIGVLILASHAAAQSGNYDVFNTSGTKIGTATFGATTLNYWDDPDTNHPPNQDAAYMKVEFRTYKNSDGHWVYFTPTGGDCWEWVKKDFWGNELDRGTLKPTNPPV